MHQLPDFRNTRRPLSLRDLVYVIVITFLVPNFDLDRFIGGDSQPPPVSAQSTDSFQDVPWNQPPSVNLRPDPTPKPTPRPNVTWLDSPVTKRWTLTPDGRWTTSKGNEQSPPSIRIGLRADGVVIWQKNRKNK